ncbi:MAG TPA: hypothetical protein VMG08_09745 [Allosphingosinicella sp.]|nr:hypothetical protein [Allosphingosinicella sp.]
MKPILPAAALLLLLAACGSGGPDNDGAPAAPANGAAPTPPANGATSAPAPADAPAGSFAAYLPAPGSHQARAMALSVPAEARALAQRMTAAIRANVQWYQAYAAQYPSGELPWHANLGISEAEYRRFLVLTNQIGLSEVGRVTFTVVRRADGGLALATGGPAAPLNGVVVYPDRNRVETPLGQLTTAAPAANRQENSPTGPWQGVRWSNLGSSPHSTRRVALSFGRRAQGDMLIFYDYGPTDAESVILLYPAAGPPALAR